MITVTKKNLPRSPPPFHALNPCEKNGSFHVGIDTFLHTTYIQGYDSHFFVCTVFSGASQQNFSSADLPLPCLKIRMRQRLLTLIFYDRNTLLTLPAKFVLQYFNNFFLLGMSKSLELMILLAHFKFGWRGFWGKSNASKRLAPAEFCWRAPENTVNGCACWLCVCCEPLLFC